MFLLTALCLVASTFALPSLELPAPPETLTLPVLEVVLDTIIPNDEQTEQSTETTVNQETNNSSDEREEEEKRIIEESKKRIIFLSAVANPPELPPLDESILATFAEAEKSEDSKDDVSENVKPFILKWRLPKIRFPGRLIIDDIFGPHLLLKH